jgi:hypothetical protein
MAENGYLQPSRSPYSKQHDLDRHTAPVSSL